MRDIDRSRASMARRIKELNRKECKTAKELASTLQELCTLNKDYIKAAVAGAMIECMNEFAVAGTPIKTGRARAGWFITNNAGQALEKPAPNLGSDEYQQMIEDNVKLLNLSDWETLFVCNNVEYILALNAGWSKRQAGNFIDRFLQELQARIAELAAKE